MGDTRVYTALGGACAGRRVSARSRLPTISQQPSRLHPANRATLPPTWYAGSERDEAERRDAVLETDSTAEVCRDVADHSRQ